MNEQKQEKSFLGMPMNWEWDTKKALRAIWYADDNRLFPPKIFGVGWTINFHAVLRKAGVIQKRSGERPKAK